MKKSASPTRRAVPRRTRATATKTVASSGRAKRVAKRAAKIVAKKGGESAARSTAFDLTKAATVRESAPAPRRSAGAPPNARNAVTATSNTRANGTSSAEGWHGWDDYAAFYDWENARTVGRRDIRFWRDVAQRTGGRVLELGCGTGRILAPLARHGIDIVGIDRSAPMLARAEQRVKRLHRAAEKQALAVQTSTWHASMPAASTRAATAAASGRARQPQPAAASAAAPAISASLLRGDIRQLPFERCSFDRVMAPYGILQSLVRERNLLDTLRAVFEALAPGGRFGLDLVPDVPRWQEYSRRVSMRGRRGPRGEPVTLVESVRQDREKSLTIFDQEFIEGRGARKRVHRFSLTFRTVSIQSLRLRLERIGFSVDAILGGYDGRPWDPRADTWVIMASKPGAARASSSLLDNLGKSRLQSPKRIR